MSGTVVKCPICENDAVVSKHPALSPSTGMEVLGYVYTCEKDGWFTLPESVNDAVTTNRTADSAAKLAKIVAKNYCPESIWPAKRTAPLQAIESIE